MNVTVVGTGYVGLVTGTGFAELGNNVLCVDIDEAKIERLNNGELPFYEPGLRELVHRNQKEGRLKFTTDLGKGVHFGDVVFSAVGTPPDVDHNADLSAVCAVAKGFGQNLEEYAVFANKSTIPVGTSERVHEIIVEELEKRGETREEAEKMFTVVSNPEFLRQGASVKDFMNPERVIIGVEEDRAREIMEHLYQPVVRSGHPLIVTDVKSAEIIKYAANSFLATKISFINEVARFCEHAGGNVREVARGIGLDSRIGPRFLHAGIGYGGSCFPKDVKAFIQTGKQKGYDFKILKAVEETNQAQRQHLVEKIQDYYGDLNGKTLAIWGLSFKPKTDDVREAPSITIIEKFRKAGAKVQAFDPEAKENARRVLGDAEITYCASAKEALERADGLVILTEWDEFRGVDFKNLVEKMNEPVVFDGRNIYKPNEAAEAGLTYFDIGRKV